MKDSNLFKENELKEYKKICTIDELKNKVGKRFFINDVEIAIFKIDENVYALNNICPHQHSALIYDGFIEDSCVVCPAHGWKFNLKTGKKPDGSNGLRSYDVKIFGKNVFVKVEDNKWKW